MTSRSMYLSSCYDRWLTTCVPSFLPIGYSIFVVTGNLPSCEADELLTLAPYEPEQKPKRNESTKKNEQKIDPEDQYQIELAEAIAASKNPSKNEEITVDPDELQLAEAIALSLSGKGNLVYETSNSTFCVYHRMVRKFVVTFESLVLLSEWFCSTNLLCIYSIIKY